MPCLFALLAGFAPRIAALLLWLARPTMWSAAFNGSWFWPILGIIFLPFTTLMYAILWSPGIGLTAWDWMWLILAVVCDLMHYSSNAYYNRNQIPGYKETPAPSVPGPRIKGFLSDPGSIALDASFEPQAVYVPGGRFDAARPVVVSLRDRRVRLEPARFVTAGASLEAAFDWDLEGGAVRGELRGRADLSMLSLLRRELRGSGQLDVDVRLGGSSASPTLDGRATVAEGRLRWLGSRQVLDGIEAAVTFDGRSVRVDTFRAFLGGGELNGRGELALGAEGAVRFDATVGVSEVSVEFPAGFRGLYDGALRLQGMSVARVLNGRLSLVRGLYDENFDLTEAIHELPAAPRFLTSSHVKKGSTHA